MATSPTIFLRSHLNAERLTELHHDNELSVRKIAAVFDVSVATIYRAMARHGITRVPHEFERHKPHLAEILTREHVTDLPEDGLTVAQIAARHDCSVQTIYKYLRSLEIEQRPAVRYRKPDGFTVENVRALYDQGKSVRAIAEQLAVSQRTVVVFMADNAIKARTYTRDVDSQAIVDGYRNGATVTELAQQHHCSAWTINNRLDKANIARRAT